MTIIHWAVLLLLPIVVLTLLVGFQLYRAARKAGGWQALAQKAQAAQAQQLSHNFPYRTPMGTVSYWRRLILLALAAGGMAFGLGGFFQFREIERVQLLQGQGVNTQAIITAKEIHESDDSADSYYLHYTFAPQEDPTLTVTHEEEVTEDLYRQTVEGQTVEIRYVRGRPEVSTLLTYYQPGKINWTAILIGSLMSAIELLTAGWLFTRLRLAARLDEEGITVTAAILERYIESDSESTAYIVACQFPGVEPFRCSLAKKLYQQISENSSVLVRYLPDNPKVFRFETGSY